MFEPICFLNLCKEMFKDEQYNDEAYLRTLISRSYYGLFLIMRDELEKHGILFPRKGDDHGFLINELRGREYFKIADKMKKLRGKRNDADYWTNKPIKEKDLIFSLQLAEQLLLDFNTIYKTNIKFVGFNIAK